MDMFCKDIRGTVCSDANAVMNNELVWHVLEQTVHKMGLQHPISVQLGNKLFREFVGGILTFNGNYTPNAYDERTAIYAKLKID